MQPVIIDQRQEIERLLDMLPKDKLSQVLDYLQYLHFKHKQSVDSAYKVVDTFEGIWQDYPIDEEDVNQARQEMWGKFGQHDS